MISNWDLHGQLRLFHNNADGTFVERTREAGLIGELMSPVNVLISSDPPKHLGITQTMLEDLLWDPVMAAWLFFRIKLDAFQAVRLRIYWLTPDVEDHSGFTSGKTIVDWVWCNLSAVLLYDCHIGAIFQTFQIGKDNFNQHHPVWCNKVVRSATAELGNHPGFRVQREYEREVNRE